jgi:outer membrane murein-binding lipoprotein Lpp
MVSAASGSTGLERYQKGSSEVSELVSTITRLSAEVTALRVTQETQARDNDARHTATETKLKMVESTISNVERSISNQSLKTILRHIRDEANKIQAMQREHAIYTRQLLEARQNGTHDRCMELQDKLEIVENQITSLRQSLDGLRDDAREQADQDATVLSETQLRNDV